MKIKYLLFSHNLFLFSSCFVFARELLEDHIHCIQDGSDSLGAKIQEKAFNSYCYISDTFTLPNFANSKKADNFPYPGIGPIGTQDESDELIYHNYYMWVHTCCCFKAQLFSFLCWCGSSDIFTNLECRIYKFFLINVFHDFFFNWQTQKKYRSRTNKNLFSFSTAQTEYNFGNKL